MNDSARRAEQWASLVGAFFAPRLGGTPEAWAQANRDIAPLWMSSRRLAPDFDAHWRMYDLAWLASMCRIVGVPAPPEAEAIALAQAGARHITSRVHAAVPGAADAIRELAARGHALHTASSERSAELAGYLEAMGVRHHFGHLFGPDLVNEWKDGPAYYERIFAYAGVGPADAVVVDDSPQAVSWAKAAGCRALLVGTDIATLADLPRLLA